MSSLSRLWSENILPVISFPLVVQMYLMAPNMASLSECSMGTWEECLSLGCWMDYSADVNGSSWSVMLFSSPVFSWNFCICWICQWLIEDSEFPSYNRDSSVSISNSFSFCLMYLDTLMLMHAHEKLLCLLENWHLYRWRHSHHYPRRFSFLCSVFCRIISLATGF